MADRAQVTPGGGALESAQVASVDRARHVGAHARLDRSDVLGTLLEMVREMALRG